MIIDNNVKEQIYKMIFSYTAKNCAYFEANHNNDIFQDFVNEAYIQVLEYLDRYNETRSSLSTFVYSFLCYNKARIYYKVKYNLSDKETSSLVRCGIEKGKEKRIKECLNIYSPYSQNSKFENYDEWGMDYDIKDLIDVSSYNKYCEDLIEKENSQNYKKVYYDVLNILEDRTKTKVKGLYMNENTRNLMIDYMKNPNQKLRVLAERYGITKQRVSDYVQKLRSYIKLEQKKYT